MLTPNEISKSIHETVAGPDGKTVLVNNATYSGNSITLTHAMVDQEYCQTHKAEVQEAMSNFLSGLNEVLDDEGFPVIVPTENAAE